MTTRPTHRFKVLPLFLAFTAAQWLYSQNWQPADNPLMTRWAEQVSPENPWPEYPRPQMVRGEWQSLNGLWDYAVVPQDSARPDSYAGKILVPYPVESALSGVKEPVSPEQKLWYRRSFDIPPGWRGRRVLLHFGAVDWQATVFVNGVKAGEHRGGYTPFQFDITRLLNPGAEQEIVVAVWDPTDTGTQPRGKQVSEPGGIWYTAVTGIWQSVWLEPVPEVAIAQVEITPDLDDNSVEVEVLTDASAERLSIRAIATDGGQTVAEREGAAQAPLKLSLSQPKLWSPDAPNLYDLAVELRQGDEVLDRVESYFGMRKIALGKDSRGHVRLFLNNEPLFHFGPLDQGWWPDGLYTAATDEALRYDIKVTRDFGFNMARKHVKVEPARWYYHCDRLGLMVWQDMPSGNLRRSEPNSLMGRPGELDAFREGASKAQFEYELRELIDHFSHFPSIVMWVPFNEGWGQYDTARIAAWIKRYDPTRLVTAASGWTDRGVGDVYDTHAYPGPGIRTDDSGRALVLGEFGGLGWPVDGHLWWDRRNWGYLTYFSRDVLAENYRRVVGDLYGLLGRGVAAAIYTQTSDVEGEVNGLMTYDRAMVKFEPAELRKLHAKFYAEPPRTKTLLASSEASPQAWKYTLEEPPSAWAALRFDDASWAESHAPFTSGDFPLLPIGTPWIGSSVWLRRSFTVEEIPQYLWMEMLRAVDDGAVYLNGRRIIKLADMRPTNRHYHHFDVSEHAEALKKGRNVIAVYGRKARGRRAIDVGLYAVEPVQ